MFQRLAYSEIDSIKISTVEREPVKGRCFETCTMYADGFTQRWGSSTKEDALAIHDEIADNLRALALKNLKRLQG